tara:strand:+ start:1474 stop:2460 length:987 start_codon:yes stop_codon:yes gene_type:complete
MKRDYLSVFCPRMGMGDLITFVGLFKTIHQETGKKLIIITKENTSGKQYLLDEPYCVDVVYLPKHKRGILKFFSNLKDFFNLVKMLKEHNKDEIFILHSSKRYVLAAISAGIKKIYAPGLGVQNFFVNKNNSYYKNFFQKRLHPRLEGELLLKKIFGINKTQNNLLINMKTDKEQSHVLIGIASSGHVRQWGYENHKLIIDYLIKKNYKKFYLLSGKDQVELENKLIKNFSSKEIFIEGTSNLSLQNIFKKAKKGKFYFGHDTGFMYLSLSLNIPAIGLFGEVPPYFYSDNMKSITPEDKIFGKNSIQNISFKNAISELDKFISVYKL